MRWLLYPLAAIGSVTVAVFLVVLALAPRSVRRSRRQRIKRARAHRIRLEHAQQSCAQLGVPEPEFEAVVETYRSGVTAPEGRTP